MNSADLPTSDVLGVRCVVGDVASAAEAVIARALSRDGGYGVLCNVHVLMTALHEPRLLRAIQGAWAAFPDGAPIAWFQRRTGFHLAARIGGPDLLPLVVDRGRERRVRHALYGSTPEVVAALRTRLALRFPGAEIVMAHAPEPGEEGAAEALRRLSNAQPHLIWCALGAPKQELWMARYSAELAPALLLGVGAAFDFHAGAKKRAPAWIQRGGLEWAHRLAHEPRRLASRYIVTNSRFVVGATRALCGRPHRCR